MNLFSCTLTRETVQANDIVKSSAVVDRRGHVTLVWDGEIVTKFVAGERCCVPLYVFPPANRKLAVRTYVKDTLVAVLQTCDLGDVCELVIYEAPAVKSFRQLGFAVRMIDSLPVDTGDQEN